MDNKTTRLLETIASSVPRRARPAAAHNAPLFWGIGGRAVFVALLFFLAGPGFAQDAPDTAALPAAEAPPEDESAPAEGAYYLERTGEGVRFIQHLVWAENEFASRYEVVIEVRVDDRYEEVWREPVEVNFIDVSLIPGSYRYKVLVYNLLNRLDYETDWAFFTVIRALEPSLTRLDPDLLYLDEETPRELRLTGRNLLEESEILLVPLDEEGDPVKPLAYRPSPSGEEALLVFDGSLLPGTYRILVKNPGGLETSLEPFRAAYPRNRAVYVSLGYAPLLSLYGHTFDYYTKRFFPLGAYARVEFAPFQGDWGSVGFEAEPYWNYLSPDDFDIPLQFGGLLVHVVYRKPFFNQRLAFTLRLGAGAFVEFGSYEGGAVAVLTPTINGGISLQWVVYRGLYLELGAEYVHGFSDFSFNTTQPGFVRPSFGLGWRF